MSKPLKEWEEDFVADMRAIGLLRDDRCLGCGKFSCFGCPAGMSSAVDHAMLSPAAAERLKAVMRKRNGLEREPNPLNAQLDLSTLPCGCLGDSPSTERCDGLWIRCNTRLNALRDWQEAQAKQAAR